jgi:hypothetical protein
MSEMPSHPPDGRPLSWRVGMLTGAALLGGVGYAVLRWPQIIQWSISAVFFALAALLAVSALLARGRRR